MGIDCTRMGGSRNVKAINFTGISIQEHNIPLFKMKTKTKTRATMELKQETV